MKKTIALSVLLILCIAGQQLLSNSTGAFRVTGSQHPGTCVMCHAGVQANADPAGAVILDIEGAPGYYVPGKTYEITVTTSYNTFDKFGFACDVVDTNKSVTGTLSAMGSDETQLKEENTYITHTLKGTAGTDHHKTWKYSWTAPDAYKGDITFYVASVAANGDKMLAGDRVYTTTRRLKFHDAITYTGEVIAKQSLCIFPVPAVSYADLSCSLNVNEDLHISIYNSGGREIESEVVHHTQKGFNTFRVWFTQQHEPGIYLLRIRAGKSLLLKKIIMQ